MLKMKISAPPIWIWILLWFAVAIFLPEPPPQTEPAPDSLEAFNLLMGGDTCVIIRDPKERKECRSR
jgi:hypothetical protein